MSRSNAGPSPTTTLEPRFPLPQAHFDVLLGREPTDVELERPGQLEDSPGRRDMGAETAQIDTATPHVQPLER